VDPEEEPRAEAGYGVLRLDGPEAAEAVRVGLEVGGRDPVGGLTIADDGRGVADVVLEPQVPEVRLRRQRLVRRRVRDVGERRALDAEQPTDRLLRLAVLALAEVDVADMTETVDQVLRGCRSRCRARRDT
jgi:hypothetical protein